MFYRLFFTIYDETIPQRGYLFEYLDWIHIPVQIGLTSQKYNESHYVCSGHTSGYPWNNLRYNNVRIKDENIARS